MNIFYFGVSELAIVFMTLIILIISKYYIKKTTINYAIYVFLAYFLVVLTKLMIISEFYLTYFILAQYYLYLVAIYLIYKKAKDYFEKEWDNMGIAIFMTIFAIFPLLLWFYFSIDLVYFTGKTLYAFSIIIFGFKVVFSDSVSINKKAMVITFVCAAAGLLFTNLFEPEKILTIFSYLMIVVFELMASILIINSGHAYLKLESDKRTKIYESIYNNSTDAILVLRYETIEECNEKALEVFKTNRENLVGNSIIKWSRDIQEKSRSAYDSFYSLLERGKSEDIVGLDWTFYNSDIEEVASEISLFELNDKQFAMLIRDMSYKYVDDTTGFTKREYLKNRLSQLLKKDATKVALLALNIDNFKVINDEFGFTFGDKILTEVADRLKEEFFDNSISRIVGDEFVVLLDDIGFLNQIYIHIEKIKEVFEKPFEIDGNSLTLSVCIGVLYNSEGEKNAVEIINNVDFILNVAKKNGRGSIEFYSKNHKADFANRMTIERDMEQGIINGDFVPFYQPIVNPENEDIVGAEALVRWIKADGTVVYPDAFIRLAEENGMIVDIDYSMLKSACQHCKEMVDIYPDFTVHVNMSGYHFTNDDIVNEIKKNLEETGLEGSKLVIEVTETLFVKDLEMVSDIVDKIRELGVRIALDDFGTGYSSLSYLSRMKVDIVKIDRIFIMNIPYDEKAKALVEFIVLLNKTFKFEVVVEGVEDRAQVDYLKWLTIDYIQGYYYYKPVEFNTIKRLLENNYGL